MPLNKSPSADPRSIVSHNDRSCHVGKDTVVKNAYGLCDEPASSFLKALHLEEEFFLRRKDDQKSFGDKLVRFAGMERY